MKPSPRLEFVIDPWETTRLIGSTYKSRKGLSGGVLIDQSNHQNFGNFLPPKGGNKEIAHEHKQQTRRDDQNDFGLPKFNFIFRSDVDIHAFE